MTEQQNKKKRKRWKREIPGRIGYESNTMWQKEVGYYQIDVSTCSRTFHRLIGIIPLSLFHSEQLIPASFLPHPFLLATRGLRCCHQSLSSKIRNMACGRKGGGLQWHIRIEDSVFRQRFTIAVSSRFLRISFVVNIVLKFSFMSFIITMIDSCNDMDLFTKD